MEQSWLVIVDPFDFTRNSSPTEHLFLCSGTTFFLKHLRTLEITLTKAYGYPQYIDQLYISSHKTTAESGLPPQWFELLDGRGEGFESGQIEPGCHFFFVSSAVSPFTSGGQCCSKYCSDLQLKKVWMTCTTLLHSSSHKAWNVVNFIVGKKDPSHYITMKLQLILMQLLCFPS